MNPDDIIKLLDELGRRIGPTGQYVWQIAVKQASIDGWLTVSAGILLLLSIGLSFGVALLYSHKAWRSYRARKDAGGGGYFDSPPGWEPFIIAGMVSLFALIAGVISILVGISTLANPEYHALIDILQSLP